MKKLLIIRTLTVLLIIIGITVPIWVGPSELNGVSISLFAEWILGVVFIGSILVLISLLILISALLIALSDKLAREIYEYYK